MSKRDKIHPKQSVNAVGWNGTCTKDVDQKEAPSVDGAAAAVVTKVCECVCVHLCAFVCICVRLCASVCICVHLCARMRVHASECGFVGMCVGGSLSGPVDKPHYILRSTLHRTRVGT